MRKTPTIGLFGTCGDSTWRDRFTAAYEAAGIAYFNPLKEGWTPEDATVEAEHLVSDDLVLFPVTDETFGVGSLAEIGFAALGALRAPTDRRVLVFIAPRVAAALTASNPLAAKDSTNCRALVRAHLAALDLPCLEVVDSLDELLARSLKVYAKLKKSGGGR